MFKVKQQIVQELLVKNNLDAIIFFSPENRYWYSDFTSSLGFLVVTRSDATLFVDGRYITAAKMEAKNVIVNKWDNFNAIVNSIVTNIKASKNQIHKIGIEAEYVTVSLFNKWKEVAISANATIVPISVANIRIVKTAAEIKKIKAACALTDLAFQVVVKTIKPGMTENEVAEIISSTFKANGNNDIAFPSIVATGVRSAMPHGKASAKIINNNEIVTCDFGVLYDGFCSDMTRTFALGEVDPELRKIHQIVATAQMKGIKKIAPGVRVCEIDQICRDYITSEGYGEYFSHGTGHGLGIEVHETPYLTAHDDTILREGMVITVEPGIYIPNFGGVRIEDDILVTNDGYEILTKSSRNIDILKEI